MEDETNDTLTPEQLFLTAVDDALEERRAARIDKLFRSACFPLPTATIAELDYREGRGITRNRITRYASQNWRAEPMNLVIVSPTGAGIRISPAPSGLRPARTSSPYGTDAWTSSRADSCSRAATASRTRNC
ncbi:MAG: ATP-binding protein [Gulosibacter sp.]|uniref:ATP-binding protein n=1 Tax=Gulosibacter sp. TaxID=2817531 RepID=UPI003F91D686